MSESHQSFGTPWRSYVGNGADSDLGAMVGCGDLYAGADALAQFTHVADEADRAATLAQAVEFVHGELQRLAVEGAESLVDE